MDATQRAQLAAPPVPDTVESMDITTSFIIAQVAGGLLGIVLGSLLLYAIIRTAIMSGMKSYKRWERSGDA